MILNMALKKALLKSGLKQKELCFAIGMPESRLSNLAHGYIKPSITEAQDIAYILGEPVTTLFSDGIKEE